MNKRIIVLFWLNTILLVCFLTLPRLIRHGCFMDGELYASIANNLANGIGSFWYPSFNQYVHPFFDQQPPLTFFIQSLFFKTLGSSMYVERLYDFIFCLLHVWLIHLIWREVFRNSEVQKISWLPVVLWITIPVCSWDFVNNMEEITMGVFVQLAILFGVKIVFNEKVKFYHPLLMGASLVAAWMCKGFPGLFPLTLLFWAFLFIKSFKMQKAVLQYIMLALPIFLFIAVLYFNKESHDSISQYLNNRVLNSIKNVVETENRFYIVGRLISELLIGIAICTILLLIAKAKKIHNPVNYKLSLLFIVVGLCGVLPIMITLEQRGFYMTTAFPSFAIGLSILIANPVLNWIRMAEEKTLTLMKGVVVIGFIALSATIFFSYNKFVRDEPSLSDIYKIGKIVPAKSSLGASSDLFRDWATGCYLQRFYFIQIDACTADWNHHPFVLLNKTTANQYLPSLNEYTKVELNTTEFDLYRHK